MSCLGGLEWEQGWCYGWGVVTAGRDGRRERGRMKLSYRSTEVGQWDFEGMTSKNMSMARGEVWKSSALGSKSKSQRMDQHVNTSHGEILSTSLEHVGEGR